MAKRIYTSVDREQVAVPKPPFDSFRGQAKLNELDSCDDSMLTSGKPRRTAVELPSLETAFPAFGFRVFGFPLDPPAHRSSLSRVHSMMPRRIRQKATFPICTGRSPKTTLQPGAAQTHAFGRLGHHLPVIQISLRWGWKIWITEQEKGSW